MWRYTWQTGVDEHGDPVHCSMYKFLWTNGPKEASEFVDYTYDHHFGKPVPSFLTREETLDYFTGRINSDCNIRDYIRFKTPVRYVEFKPEEDLFTVRSEDLATGQFKEERFDHVVVAIGRYSTPNIPSFDGMDTFPGRISHSHDFRDAREYIGQDVLLIGGSFSAEDIGLQLYKFGAKFVTISYRSKPLGFNWPEKIKEVPLLVRLEGKTAHFKDGSQRDVDSIILCTGYRNHFPFMANDLRLPPNKSFYPEHLYNGVFFLDQPRLAYMGMLRFSYGLPGLDIQAWFLRDVLLGRVPLLIDAGQRAKDVDEWVELGKPGSSIKSFQDAVLFLVKYLKDLVPAISDYPPVNLEAPVGMMATMQHEKRTKILEYRNSTYVSSYTGTVSAKKQVAWLDADKEAV